MPTFSKVWRAVVAALASLFVVVLGVVPAHAEGTDSSGASSNASVFIEDSTFTGNKVDGNKVDFVVSGTNISGKTIKAIKVADYTQVQVDKYPYPTKIVGYDVKDAGHAAQIDAALTAAGIDTKSTVQTGVAYSATNPMPWLIANLKDSKTSPWAGKLRNVLTALGKNTAFTRAEGTSQTADANATSVTFSLDPGIYVFVETTTSLSKDEPYSSLSIPMMNGSAIKVTNVVSEGTANPETTVVNKLVIGSNSFDLSTADYKGTVPTIEKKIVDGSNEVDSTSQAIGQEVTFKLKTIVPNWTGYSKYQLFLTDTLGAGLTFKEITSVELPEYKVDDSTTLPKVDLTGSNKAEGYGDNWTLQPTNPTTLAGLQTVPSTGAESSFKIWFAPSASKNNDSDLVAAANKQASSPWVSTNIGRPLEVTYKAVVNRHAVINGAGNSNKVNLTFSNKPNDATSYESTPDDEVKVYTGEIDLTKTDMSGAKLAGAEFQIYKNGTTLVNVVKTADGSYRVTDNPLKDRDKTTGEEALGTSYTSTLVTPSTGKLVISGLAGNYTIKETKSPYGVADYLLPDFSFSIATALASEEATTATSTIPNFNGNAKLAASGLVSLERNTVHFTVKNPRSLLDMPKTGSIWLLIYGVGALLCAVAAYFLLFRRRSED